MDAIKPLTRNQNITFGQYKDGQNIFLHGSAGTGKTFLAMYLALRSVMTDSLQKKIVIMRSAVPTRDVGFLPGKLKEKAAEYEVPYKAIAAELFGRGDAWQILTTKGYVEFMTSSYLRGLTIPNAVIFLDEIQNYTFQEATSALTRVGEGSRLIIAGDTAQSDDLKNDRGRARRGGNRDLRRLMKVTQRMPSMSHINFTPDDIVRSGFVKEFLLAVVDLEEEEADEERDADERQ